MTSRLLNMKFMQRAAAAQASNPSSPSTPSSDRPSKRQRLSTGGSVGIASPATPTAPDPAEIKRQQALDRAAAEAGETKWVLSVQQQRRPVAETPMKIVTAGYGTIDSADIPAPAHLTVAMAAQANNNHDTSDDEHEDEGLQQTRPGLQGRRSFGKFNKALERAQNPDMSSSESEAADNDSQDEEDDESEEDEEDDDDPVTALVKQQRRETAERLRQERKAKKKADLAEAEKLAKERRKKEIKLNRTSGTGISSGGQNSGGRRSNNMTDMECHGCGQKGHLRRDCPQSRNQSGHSWTR